MRPIAARRTRSHTVANETAWDDDDDKDDDDEASVAPLFEPVLDAADATDDADADADADAEEEEVVDAAAMPHVLARMHAASTVGTCA